MCAVSILFLALQAILAGGLYSRQALQPSSMEKAYAPGERILVEGTVYRREEKKQVEAYYIKDIQINQKDQREQIDENAKILVYIKPEQSKTKMKIGNRLRIHGELDFFETARNPGNFDQRFYYRRQGIQALLWAEHVERIRDDRAAIQEKLLTLREYWEEKLTDILGEYYGHSASAILLGQKSKMDEEMEDSWRKNGIGHLLAISGLHMSFIGMGFYRILRRCGLSFGIAGVLGGVFLLLYTIMIGGSVSAMRAFVMFLIRMGAEITGRTYDTPTSLAVTGAILAGMTPLYLADAGFLLSFGAIAGLTLLTPILEEGTRTRQGKKEKKITRNIKSGLCASLAVNLFLLGPMLYFYYEIPPYSVFLNLLAIPLMSVFMGAGMAGLGLLLIWERAGEWCLSLCKVILWLYDRLCETAGILPGSRIVTGKPAKALVAGYYIGIFVICIWFYLLRKDRGKQRKIRENPGWKSYAGSGGLLLWAALFLVVCTCGYRMQSQVQMTVLDVGQGDGIFLRGPSGRCYLVDGGSSDVSAVGTYRIEPYLLSQSVRTLDYVFLTHGDADHCNGVLELLENQRLGVQVETLVLPPESVWDELLEEAACTAEKNHTRVVTMKKGDRLLEQEMAVTCLAPGEEEKEAGNASSLVLEVSYRDFEILLTGDVEGRGEDVLLEQEDMEPCDILKVAHHGSRGSTSEAFLKQTRPSIALISAGADNRYGHPHEEAVRRLLNLGCKVYSTQENGAITVQSNGKKYEIRGTLK